jgi:hypothetical protein
MVSVSHDGASANVDGSPLCFICKKWAFERSTEQSKPARLQKEKQPGVLSLSLIAALHKNGHPCVLERPALPMVIRSAEKAK